MARRYSYTGAAGHEATLEQGMLVRVPTEDDGAFVGTVQTFERQGAVAIIVPRHDAVKAVFPKGYRLGAAHWHRLERLTR